jgi:hypothetical protein
MCVPTSHFQRTKIKIKEICYGNNFFHSKTLKHLNLQLSLVLFIYM